MDQEYEELYKWVEQHQITRPKRNINRDFSDAIPLVEILKQHFPKFVDLHNYMPKNAYSQKVNNWQTVNNRVLKRIGINLTAAEIERLAKAQAGAIEKVLLRIRKKVEARSAGDEDDAVQSSEDTLNSPSNKSISRKKNRKVVQTEVWDKMENNLKEKDEAIEILKNKVSHLEDLLNIKDERLKDLNQQLQNVVNSTDSSPTRGKFLNMF